MRSQVIPHLGDLRAGAAAPAPEPAPDDAAVAATAPEQSWRDGPAQALRRPPPGHPRGFRTHRAVHADLVVLAHRAALRLLARAPRSAVAARPAPWLDRPACAAPGGAAPPRPQDLRL